MMLRVLILLSVFCSGLFVMTRQAEACAPMEACLFADGAEYRVYPPPTWDGKTPIGAFIFVHGHRANAAGMLAYKELSDTVHALGFMLVAPQGLGDSWSTPGSPGEGKRDELRFITAMLDDLEKRFPIDRKRLVASGFSQGASVVWEIACKGDGRFVAFLPVAGVWWQPMPTECTAPKRPLLHIHGVNDPVMPMGGRNLRDRWKQGDVTQAVATMRVNNGCDINGRRRMEQRGELACVFEDSCASGKPVAVCLHPGDHHTNPVWFTQVRDWLEGVLPKR
jgi:polyhydroxybutyrate depolymerase